MIAMMLWVGEHLYAKMHMILMDIGNPINPSSAMRLPANKRKMSSLSWNELLSITNGVIVVTTPFGLDQIPIHLLPIY